MPSLTRTIETDVVVVGAGLIGLAHALEARRRGLSVVLLERELRATGASVRDSGHLFFSALAAGAALEAAPQARRRWLELAKRAGTHVESAGTLIVARHRDELAVLGEAAGDPARQARMVSQAEIGALAPIPLDGVLGGLHAGHDLRIDSRSAAASLARLLARDPNARIEWGMHVHEIEPGLVHAGSLRVRAAAIVVCAGAEGRGLPPELGSRHSDLMATQTQMLRLAAPTGRRYVPTLTDGLSLLTHPAFSSPELEEQLRARIELEMPELIERGVSLVVTQDRSGDLIVGSTATYIDSPAPFSSERLDELLLGRVRALLGVAPPVRQRWTSSRAAAPGGGGDFLVSSPMPGVRVVRSVSATAAALCHSQAELVLDELLAAGDASSKDIHVHDVRGRGAGDGGGHPLRNHASAFGTRSPRER